jgi:hypothetical protein
LGLTLKIYEMKKIILTIAFLATGLVASAQVGIGNTDPKVSLQVDKSADAAKADGVLVPRVTVAELNTKAAAYGADQNGSLVFITDITGFAGKTSNVTTTGFHYYNNGTSKWTAVSGAGTSYTAGTSMNLTGNQFQRAALTGDVTAALNSNATTVTKIQGNNVSATAPTNGQALIWNGTAWTPTVATPAITSITATVTTPTYSGETVIIDDISGTHDFTLPNPANYSNKIIYYRNNNPGNTSGTTTFITYPVGGLNTCLELRGQVLFSNGSVWYLVGGV